VSFIALMLTGSYSKPDFNMAPNLATPTCPPVTPTCKAPVFVDNASSHCFSVWPRLGWRVCLRPSLLLASCAFYSTKETIIVKLRTQPIPAVCCSAGTC